MLCRAGIVGLTVAALARAAGDPAAAILDQARGNPVEPHLSALSLHGRLVALEHAR